MIAADTHPDYLSTKFARELAEAERGAPPRYLSVQHHLAHVLSCMAENELEPPILGVSWDGTGYGLDGTVWGGEFFLVAQNDLHDESLSRVGQTLVVGGAERVAHFRQFQLPGGEAAIKEPRRTALGCLYELLGEKAFEMDNLAPIRAFTPAELAALRPMLARRLNSPLTSSAGRLFDAVASLTGLRQQVRFEGQAAMELEFALESAHTNEAYELPIVASAKDHASRVTHHASVLLDWFPLLDGILADLRRNLSPAEISAKFHNALVEAIIRVARRFGERRVVLTGGCFQNRYLTERAVSRLREEGFRPYWHQRVPPNDGGISLGQIVAALRAAFASRE